MSLYMTLALFVISIFYITTTSLAISCYRKDPQSSTSSYGFLIINLIAALIALLASMYGMYIAYTNPLSL